MANVLANNASVFKSKKDEQKKIETPVIKQASIPAATGAIRALSTGTSTIKQASIPAATGAIRALSTGTSTIKPFTKNTSGSVSPAQNTKATQEYKPGALSMRVIVADRQQGKDWSNASDAQKAYNNTYYRTLDDKKHTDMYLEMEGFRKNYSDEKWYENFQSKYKAGQDYLNKELADIEKRYGKESNEYKALDRFMQDYENVARWAVADQSDYSAKAFSKQLDDTIDSVFAGYTSAPDYQAKVEKGKKEILGNPKKYGTFTLGMKGASEKQKDLLYAVFAEEGEKGAEDFYKRFLNPTVSRIGAAQEFSDTIASDSKAKRALGAIGAAVGGAVANSSILGGGVQKGIDVLTGKAKALDDDVLAGDFTVQDSVDNTLRREFAGINQADLDQYGLSGLDAMKGAHDGKKTSTGQYGLGNIDLTNRDTGLYDEDGNLMTVKSMSFEEDGKEILVPTIVKKDGKWVELSEKDAIDWYHQTGEYLGKFDTVDQANAYAQRLHQDQQQLYTDYDWLKAVDQDATDYQKQLLGYVYMASDRDEAAAKDLWEAIKARDSEIRQTVNGGTYGTTSRDAVQSGLYQEYLDKNKLMLGMYKAAVTTGSQLDRVALSFIPVVGQALNLGTMGLSVFGNAYSEDVLNGREEDWKTAGHALTSAALEVVMEKLLSGVAHIPGIAVDEMSKRFVKNIANPWGRAAVNTFLRFQSEGLEEGLTDAANALSTGLWFGEGDIASRAKQGFELDDVDLQQMLESYFYGGISAIFLGGLTTAGEVVDDINYRELGHHLNTLESTDKLIDTILSTKINEKAGKSSKKLYDEAKELAQGMKDGKLKKNDVNVGEMFANFAKSGGDVQWLTNPDTVNYNKDTLTEENFIAGATSRLAELGADTTLAGDIARWAMGQAPSQEAFNKIKSDPKAVQVLQELIDPLDMEKDNALTRAAQSTTRNVTGDKTYDTLVASNPDQTVVNPATQQLISLGVELEEAQDIGDVIAKVMSGEAITEDEAELVSVSNAAVRSVLSEVAGVELSENATIGAVMDALNGVAAEAADTKAKQAAVAEGAEAAARARMPIPPNTRQTITAGGIEFGHDEFIQDYMAQHNATLEQAEEAWAQRAGISAALNGEEENNGTISGKQEGRNPGLAGRGPIPAAQERTAGSGRADVSGTERGTQTSGQRPAGAVQENQITKYNSEQREFIQDCVSDGFSSVSLVNGPILVAGVDENGNPITFEVNARVDSNGKLTIRWDNPYASPVSIANHERIHRWLDMVFGLHNSERTAFVMNFLNEAFDGNEAALQEMYDKYSEQYGAAYSKYSPQEAAAAIYEEIFSDMYAGLDMYDAGAAAFQEQAQMYVMQEGLREQALGEETENEAGNKFSVSVTGPNGEIIGTLDYDDDVSPNRIANDIRHYRETGELRQDGPNAPYERWKRAAASGIEVGITVDRKTQSAAPSDFRYSLATWKKSDYVTDVENAARELSEVLDVSITKARAYINTLNSVAKAIADDKTRLDYEASPGVSALIGNTEYGGSIDFSTICKKRRLITGTFTAIQRALPNTALTAEEVLTIRKMMDERGYEVNCGLCYVEGSRAKMGEYAKQFLNEYAKTDPAYLPNMAEINTPEGIEQIRLEHPDVYAAYEKFMNKLAQRKPKLYQMATAYDGEVLHKFEDKQKQVEKYNRNGGLRLQSFSDFEIIHLLDNMQVIIDMARVGLFGQAYTKVPEFAWAMGKTGLKINLSLIAKAVDANGRLLLDEKEGMKRADVDALRKAYPDTVGSIVVVFNNEQLLAAMADPFIDYIIPFHRSQWNQKLYELMGLPEGAKDFTPWQNESYIEPVYSESGKPQRPANYMPNTYWDYNKSGKENAEAYLQMCAANNRLPKFSFLLDDNGDGSYSLKEDGSTDGYWKLLIDFKMYDNDGKGVPQRAVEPIFNEGPESDPRTVLGMLKAYEGGHQNFPVAEDVVEDFVREYKASHPMERYSVANNSDRYSLTPVPAVEPSGDSWNRTHTTEEAMEIYPDLWNVSAEESETRNPTQIASTQGTYRNIYKILQDQGFDGKILDASSGLGIGTQIGRDEFGFDVEDIEPYPGENYSPMYTDYSKLNKKYDAIISSAVLNVLPQDQRDALVVKMGELLNDGGKMYITTRGKDVDSLAKTGKNIQLGPMEWIETVRGSYQKGFTQNELKAYLEDALGPGFTVELSNKSNGGKFNNNTSIVVTKNGAAQNEAETAQERYSMVDKQFNDWAPEFYSKMERVVNDWTNGKGQPLGAKMAASQVVGWLKGKGVKSEEIKWSGIVPYLEGKKTVTKEELQQVMAENEVKIETKVLESGTGFKFWSDRDWEEVTVDSLEDLYEYAYFLAGEEGFDPEYVKLYPSNDGYYITRDDTGEIIVDATRNDAGDTRWSEYKTDLQDGFNYREILFKQPGLNYTNRAMQVHWGSEDQDGAKAEGKDVIAHARVQDTFTPETKGSNVSVPTIFIEEIQSDLHNAGTAKQTPENTRGFTREHAAPGFAGKLQREYQRYLDIMDGRDLNPAEQSRYDWIVKQLEPGGLAQAREAYTQAMEQRRALDEDLDQVVAEIKERTRDFQQLGLLRGKDSEIRAWVTASNPRGSFRYADESFLDSLINGSVNEAYSFPAELIARIENIRAAYQTSRDASEDLIAANRGLSMAPPEVPFAGSSDTYHEYVMKHMLRLAAEGGYDRVAWTTAQQQSDRWSDEYAEGYKIEYDQAIPKFMNKYVKQWGGKVGTTVLDNGEEVWSVDITPEMKDSVLHEGQPRFSVAPTDKNSNPFKEGSLEATVSDLIQKADDGQALQDTINALIEKRNESLKQNNAPVIPSKDKARPVGEVQRTIQQNQLQDLIGKYGALKKGEKAAKDVTLPERTSDERYTRRFVRTTEEAAGIPERMNERIDDSLLTEDLLTYSRITDKMAVKKGDSDFESLGYKKAIKEWNENRAGTGHQPTKYDIAFGERLMIEAARNGDEAVALKVLADLASMETQAGQVVQAARLLKKLGPTGQLYYIQKAVDRLNKQNEGRIAKGSMQPVTIDKELAKAVILSETDEQMKDAMDELIASIAEQLPVTLKDKWDAWRYLSMLGNPRTHIRNVFGNAVFSPIRFTKDLLASAGEKMFIKDPLERTKAADARLGSKKYDAVREFAASDFEEMKQQITGTGKMNPLNEIMDKRKIFKSKAFGWLNKLSDWNSDMLEKEDAIFLRKAYIDAMTQFIAAKGLTLEELTGSYEGGKILNDARQYAALEAQKATYRDFNQMASALNQMKRTSGVGWFIDGLMPFTKTPMNILRRGIEYSPVGLANGIYSSLVKVGKGDISAAGAIDQIAAGMTGTGIAILGYFLAKMGLARGGEDDDDKKAQLESAEGHQNYSLEIPGYGSYTIDWMAPVALPFFVGVEVFNQLSDGGPVTGWDLANALTMIAEPMMSLSMLDGLNSTLSAVRYGDKDEAVMSVATNILTSYLSQGAPTIFGQIARTIDPDRRSTYTDKNSATPAWLQRFVQGVQGKAPGVESQKMAYVDTWGRKDTNASLFWRALENFISPGYANRINETPVDRELTRLAESLGDTSVLPSSISKYYQLNGERLDLNAKQYEKLKTVTGQTAFSLLGNMMDDAAYIAMGDEEKAAVVKQIMSISAAIGKQAVTPDYKPDAWIQRAIDQDNLETAAVYHALEKLDTGLSNYQLISAMDWLTDEDRGKLIMSEHTNTSRNMTDYAKKKYKFVLTDEQIAREREIYNDLFWPEYANLINDPKYINAGVAERANMISKMQSSLGEAARRQLGDELRAAGYTSVLLDDSDVPEQVTDLYTLLNRG